MVGEIEVKRKNYTVEYKGNTLSLGQNWKEVLEGVEKAKLEVKIEACLKLKLYHRLKDELKLGSQQLEKVLQQYADSLPKR